MSTKNKTSPVARWHSRPIGNTGKWIIEADHSSDVIAELPASTSETERNIIAAAPALLAALQESMAVAEHILSMGRASDNYHPSATTLQIVCNHLENSKKAIALASGGER